MLPLLCAKPQRIVQTREHVIQYGGEFTDAIFETGKPRLLVFLFEVWQWIQDPSACSIPAWAG